jgi:hypothetical protein
MFGVSVAGVAIGDVAAAELRIGQGKDGAAMLVRLRGGHQGTKTLTTIAPELGSWPSLPDCFFQVCASALLLLYQLHRAYDAALARCSSRQRAGGTPSQVRKARTKELESS